MLRATLLSLLALVPLAAAQDVLAPELREAMAAAAPGARVPAYLVMRDQLTLQQVQDATRGLHGRPLRAAVTAVLEQHAAESQAGVRALLDGAVARGDAAAVQVLWMGNGVVFEAKPEVLTALAALPGVDRMQRQSPVDLAATEDTGASGAAAPLPAGSSSATALTPEPNLVALQAPSLWHMGVTGAGVMIANVDTGTWISHPDLVNRIWNNPGEIPANGVDDDGNGYIDDVHGWDFVSNNNDVTGSDPHGTETAGIVCGDGSSGVKQTGMAPGVTMVVCQMSNEQNYWLCQQYALLVGVDVVTSSNSFKWIFSPKPDYHMDRQICDMELAAGIIHSNSIGNQGTDTVNYPIPFNIATPGNCPTPFAHPDEVSGGRSSVMGCGGLDLPGDTLYIGSGKGPAAWDDILQYDASYPWTQNPAYWDYPKGGFAGAGPGLLKPDVMTYTDVQTTYPTATYTLFGGTSAATPHLGGALCLMRQAQPQAEPRHIAAALELTASDMGTPGKDNIYGTGKIRCAVAARRLLVVGRFDTQTPGLGDPVTLDVFGPPSEVVYAFIGAGIHDDATDWNLDQPFFFFGVMPLDATGHLAVPAVVPNDATLVGATAWFQFGAQNHLPGWGPGPLLSVPESITVAP
ncbi:MAG TPA: S8 family serine peptidase [Planctomycetota bacterium]|nr:S8 family serine peptidase [Planctomycetota bacterium]